jgi:hypothetical protein
MKGLELPMTLDKLDISDSLTWEEDLPRPQWDLINTSVESQISAHERDVAWAMIGRQWLEKLGPALGRPAGYNLPVVELVRVNPIGREHVTHEMVTFTVLSRRRYILYNDLRKWECRSSYFS